MTPHERLAAATPEVRQHVLELLDAMSAPMHPRHIERALCDAGFSRSQARPLVNILKRLPVIAIGAGEP